ncbi:DUF2207 domain-containing protein [Nesterenkonia muleiensis]|uniref:DUF2207 domain-containing protein n=1 Tax=Nesterenkonia muleiensis TaxID=2282648 RepID=UPI000E726674|nr:DUF2207 domain-containing protein [Nesterenkonia muleiensis]
METSPSRPFWQGLFIPALTLLLLGASAAPTAAVEAEDVENFHFDSWELSYELDLDLDLDLDDDVAVAHVTEELVARFPEHDQNRGLVRALPLRYHSAPAAPEDIAVTDASGAEVPFETETEDGMQVILIGDDEYVHGQQTYQLSYTVQNVIHSPGDADIDEFYWDLVPSQRPQSIDSASVQIDLSPEFAEAFNGDAACYAGAEGSSEPCEIDTGDPDDGAFTVPSVSLEGYEGLTVALGFEAGTVPQPPERQPNWILDTLPAVLGLVSAGLGTAALITVLRLRSRHRQDTGDTLPRYGIPDDVPMLIAAPVTAASGSPVTAEILRLAVRGALRIEDSGKTSGVFSRTPEPMLRLTDPHLARDPLEERLLTMLFPSLQPGDTFKLPSKGKDKQSFSTSMQKLVREGPKEAEARGLLTKKHSSAAVLLAAAGLLLIGPVAILLLIGTSRDNVTTTVIALLGGMLGLVCGLIAVFPQRVHTHEGAGLRQQLESVRTTIRGPEQGHGEMLQSSEHALSQHAEDAATVQLYDKVLPFAVIYGLEKQWSKVLDATYRSYGIDHPVWYPGLFRDGSGSLESTLSGFTSAMTTSSGTSGSSGAGGVGGGGGGGAAGGR